MCLAAPRRDRLQYLLNFTLTVLTLSTHSAASMPLHHCYIAVTLPLHYRYITETSGAPRRPPYSIYSAAYCK